jgi:nucleoside-diphosphate-sugar epimerase
VRVLVTGTSGHLGEALARTLPNEGFDVVGLDLLPSAYTATVGSACDAALVRRCMEGVEAVVHTATLHKPHVGTHSPRDFVETNILGTLTLLEAAVAEGVRRFIFTSTTSLFGLALVPPPGAPAAWITEDVQPIPKNIYGVTKSAAEGLCWLFHLDHGIECIVLRTSRFFFEPDDNPSPRDIVDPANVKVCELLYRRVDIEDVAVAHSLALHKAPSIGFGTYIISATTPFTPDDLAPLRTDASGVVQRLFPQCEETFEARGWRLFSSIDRVYVNQRAREALGWSPRFDFGYALSQLRDGKEPMSALASTIGAKGYHSQPVFPYTVR